MQKQGDMAGAKAKLGETEPDSGESADETDWAGRSPTWEKFIGRRATWRRRKALYREALEIFRKLGVMK